jgi:hypothetical protein
MRQRELLSYINRINPDALRAVQAGPRAAALPELTAADKALIYHYSEDGYEALNDYLHANSGANDSVLGQGLVAALKKLPPYEGEVQSGIWLRASELQFYRGCARTATPVRWPAFLSATLKPGIAMQFLRSARKNCLFVIQSRTGRLIEAVAKTGLYGQAPGQNEREVLFAPQTEFDVLAVVDETDYTRIVLDEL